MGKFMRLISILLCFVFCIMLFAGCGKKDNTQNTENNKTETVDVHEDLSYFKITDVNTIKEMATTVNEYDDSITYLVKGKFMNCDGYFVYNYIKETKSVTPSFTMSKVLYTEAKFDEEYNDITDKKEIKKACEKFDEKVEIIFKERGLKTISVTEVFIDGTTKKVEKVPSGNELLERLKDKNFVYYMVSVQQDDIDFDIRFSQSEYYGIDLTVCLNPLTWQNIMQQDNQQQSDTQNADKNNNTQNIDSVDTELP